MMENYVYLRRNRNSLTVNSESYDRIVGKGPNYPHTNFQWHTKISTCFQFKTSVYSDDCSYGLDLEREGQPHQKY